MVAARQVIPLQPFGVVDHLRLQGRRVDGQHQGAGEQADEIRGAAGEQGEVVLPARKGAAAAQAVEQLGRVRPGLGAADLRQQAGEQRGLLGAAGEQVERKDAHAVQRVLGALRLGVEPADGLDGVAEEIEADGRLLPRREEVEDAAADCEVADLVDQVGAAVPPAHQAGGEVVEQVVLPRPDLQHRPGVVLGERQAAEQRAGGGDHGPRHAGGDPVEGHGLLGAHEQGGLGLLVRSQRRRGEVDDPLFVSLRIEQPRRLDPGQRIGLARDQDDEGAAEVAGEQLAHPGRGRDRQTHDIPEPLEQGLVGRAAAQGPGEVLPHLLAHRPGSLSKVGVKDLKDCKDPKDKKRRKSPESLQSLQSFRSFLRLC